MLVGDELAGHAHVLVVAGAPEAVVDHGIDGFGVAHAHAFAGGGQEIGGVRHGLHAAGYDDFGVAEGDGLGAERDRFEAAAADHVEGHGGYCVGEASAQGGLPGGVLAEAGWQDAAHEAFVYSGCVDARAAHGFAHYDGS